MPRFDDYTRAAIRFWEKRRIIHCLALVIPAYFGHMFTSGIQAGLGYPQNGTPTEMALRYAYTFAYLNICYTFAYAAEFLFRTENSQSFWLTGGRHIAFVAGLLLGCLLALSAGGAMGIFEFSFR